MLKNIKKTIQTFISSAVALSLFASPINVLAYELYDDDNIETYNNIFIEQNETIEQSTGTTIEQMSDDFIADIVNQPEIMTFEQTHEISQTEPQIDYIYLSDKEYDPDSNAPYGGVKVNTNVGGKLITLRLNGEVITFPKGIGAHATSNVIYNISDYTDKYPILDMYMGIDACQGTKGDIKFTISGSNDKQKWENIYVSETVTAADEAIHIHEDVSQYTYIKFHANQIWADWNDHASYGNVRLLSRNYNLDSEIYKNVKTLEEYDKEIALNSAEENYNNKKLILEREFINRVGYQTLQSLYAQLGDKLGDALDWLLTDKTALELFIEAGNYYAGKSERVLTALADLYQKHKTDMTDELYKKMLLATAGANSTRLTHYMENFGGNPNSSDPVERYEIMKWLYDNGRFQKPEQFENYNMELMRLVMGVELPNEEIVWFNYYLDKAYGKDFKGNYSGQWNLGSYGSIKWNEDKYYNADNYDTYNSKYHLDGVSLGIPEDCPWINELSTDGDKGYGTRIPRTWMLIDGGGICWPQTGMGVCANLVKGVAALNTYQPRHQAEMLYSQNADGYGAWNLGYDVSGWNNSYTKWDNSTPEFRIPLEWGLMSFNTRTASYNSTYIVLAQDAFNNESKYKASMYYNLIAKSYKVGSEDYYNALKLSLNAYDKNLDTINALIKAYENDENANIQGWVDLNLYIIEHFKFFPYAMIDLCSALNKHISSEGDSYAVVQIAKNAALNEAKNATTQNTLQNGVCQRMANYFLGKNSYELAHFSFDGDKAGIIRLDSAYDGLITSVRVSIDGGKTWLKFADSGDDIYTNLHEMPLTKEQIASITAENDILVGIRGTALTDNYVIDIKVENAIPDTVYLNDDENLLIGEGTKNLEYSLDGGLNWNDYSSDLKNGTRIEGEKTALFRYKSYGVYLTGKPREYHFTKSTDIKEDSYIQLKNVKLISYSSEQSTGKDHAAANLIDGNINTAWHTKFSVVDTSKHYTVELDKVRFITKLKYKPSGLNGRWQAGEVYTSLDNDVWTLAGTFNSLANDESVKTIELDEPTAARYVKVKLTNTYGNAEGPNKYTSGKMLSFYEDTTKVYETEVSSDVNNKPELNPDNSQTEQGNNQTNPDNNQNNNTSNQTKPDNSQNNSTSNQTKPDNSQNNSTSNQTKPDNSQNDNTNNQTKPDNNEEKPDENEKPNNVQGGSSKFVDVKADNWYTSSIDYVLDKGLMNGVSDDKFSPDTTSVRAMIVTVLYRMSGSPEQTANKFDDIKGNEWYAQAVNWAAENGVVNGVGNGKFAPNDMVTRQQLVTMLYNYVKFAGIDTDNTHVNLDNFRDYSEISDYAKEAMQWAIANEIINGVSSEKLDPNGSASRAQIATILARFDMKFSK